MQASDHHILSMQERILSCLELEISALTKVQLIKKLNLEKNQRPVFKNTLKILRDQKKIIQHSNRYTLVKKAHDIFIVEAYLKDQKDQFIFRPINLPEHHELYEKKIKILMTEKTDQHNQSPHFGINLNDQFLVSLISEQKDSAQIQILKKMEHKEKQILCWIENKGKKTMLFPLGRKTSSKFYIANIEAGDRTLKHQEIVLSTPVNGYENGVQKANIIKRFGHQDKIETLHSITFHKYGIPNTFSTETIKETHFISQIECSNRTDLRALPFITIDPEDARDHDDAVWAQSDSSKDNPDGHIIIVAIADVSAYIKPQTALDIEARQRGFSIYLPDRVIPMLPEKLSNELCSLVKEQDRLCLAVRMRFNKSGERIDHTFMRAIIRSHAKLSYEQAQRAYKTPTLLEHRYVLPLFKAYHALKKHRKKRSPLEINSEEKRIYYESNTQTMIFKTIKRLDTHKLIEEFMIQANNAASQSLKKCKMVLYRTHATPSSEKIDALCKFLPFFNLSWSKGQLLTCKRFNELLFKAKKHDIEEIIQEMVLRSQSQAQYQSNNIGHFGLNLNEYVHFTSPIRRYSDLIIHRALILHHRLGTPSECQHIQTSMPDMDLLSETLNQLEKRAVSVERELNDQFISFYLGQKINHIYEGMIINIAHFGIFVRLKEYGCDGFIPIRKLGAHYLHFHPETKTLKGKNTYYYPGQKIKVLIREANAFTRSLIFDIVEKDKQRLDTKPRKKKKS